MYCLLLRRQTGGHEMWGEMFNINHIVAVTMTFKLFVFLVRLFVKCDFCKASISMSKWILTFPVFLGQRVLEVSYSCVRYEEKVISLVIWFSWKLPSLWSPFYLINFGIYPWVSLNIKIRHPLFPFTGWIKGYKLGLDLYFDVDIYSLLFHSVLSVTNPPSHSPLFCIHNYPQSFIFSPSFIPFSR